jgi:UDP-N-acetylmuramate dehydrogenase
MELRIVEKVPLAAYTTLRVGGVANYFCQLTDEAQLLEVAVVAEEKQVPITVLGGGSNVLIADGAIHRLIIRNEIRGMTFTEDEAAGVVLVTAAAGEPWDVFVATMVERGLAGLENLSGIPGTVGAAPIQNINAYGAQVADVIESVRVFDTKTKTFQTRSSSECQFAYRDSVFKHERGGGLVVTAVTFRLTPVQEINLTYRSASQSIERYLEVQGITTPTLLQVREAILYTRSNIGMLEGQFRSAGSFFKNTIVSAADFARVAEIVSIQFSAEDTQFSPWHWSLPDGGEKISTAFLMECTPYNKRTYGEKRWRDVVGLSPKHSLSVVTEESATATDVQTFVAEIITAVEKVFGVTIETEVNFISTGA